MAYQFAESIVIKGCRQAFLDKVLFSDCDELFIENFDGGYCYIFQYGMLVFFNHSEAEVDSIVERVKPFANNWVKEPFFEEIKVGRATSDEVKFDSVLLKDSEPEAIRLVMLNASQSVALDNYSTLADELLVSTRVHTQYLEAKGKLDIGGNKLKRYIGRTLNIKNQISENLYIFESPDITWENERLNTLNQKLKLVFDLKDRYHQIHDKIEIVKENLELFKDIMDHKDSSRLEWIIIILILVEVLDHFIIRIL